MSESIIPYLTGAGECEWSRMSAEDRARFAEMVRDGKSAREVARAINEEVSVYTAREVCGNDTYDSLAESVGLDAEADPWDVALAIIDMYRDGDDFLVAFEDGIELALANELARLHRDLQRLQSEQYAHESSLRY